MSRLVEEALLDSADEVATLTAADINEKELKLIIAYCEHHIFSYLGTAYFGWDAHY